MTGPLTAGGQAGALGSRRQARTRRRRRRREGPRRRPAWSARIGSRPVRRPSGPAAAGRPGRRGRRLHGVPAFQRRICRTSMGCANYQPPVMSRVYAGDGRLLAELATERRIFVPISAIPDIVKQAFVSAEDQNFYTHRGVDPLAIARAGGDRPGACWRRAGGRSAPPRSPSRSPRTCCWTTRCRSPARRKEAILALRIEQTLTKDRILELYLNEIYLGLGSYGVAAAAQTYFNKPLDKLTSPRRRSSPRCRRRRTTTTRSVPRGRARRGATGCSTAWPRTTSITAEQAAAAKAEPIVPARSAGRQPIPGADWFAEEVRRQLIARFGADTTTAGRAVGAHQPRPGAAGRRREGAARRADRLRPQAWAAGAAPVGPSDDAGRRCETQLAGGAGRAAAPAGHAAGLAARGRAGATDGEAQGRLARAGRRAAAAARRWRWPMSAWARPVRDGKLGAAPQRIDRRGAGRRRRDDRAAAVLPARRSRRCRRRARRRRRRRPPANRRAAADSAGAGRAGLAGPAHRPGAGDGRRLELRAEPVQPRDPGQRQPGSSFKPMVYLTALEKGISPSQRFLDAPIVMDQRRQGAGGRAITSARSAARRRCASRWRSR